MNFQLSVFPGLLVFQKPCEPKTPGRRRCLNLHGSDDELPTRYEDIYSGFRQLRLNLPNDLRLFQQRSNAADFAVKAMLRASHRI